MSHITIIIQRVAHDHSGADADPESIRHASAEYVVPHAATDAEVGQAVKKLVKQVRELGA